MSRYRFRPSAWRDIEEASLYLEEHGSGLIAGRFLEAVDSGCANLAKFPHLGTPCLFELGDLGAMRRWPLPGFENWLVFYQPDASGVDVIRVLHGARDLELIFAEGS